jgi:hypothetical protein
MEVEATMDTEQEKVLLAKYPFHIYLMVKAAKQALDSGRARIENGMLVFQPQPETSEGTKPENSLIESAEGR